MNLEYDTDRHPSTTIPYPPPPHTHTHVYTQNNSNKPTHPTEVKAEERSSNLVFYAQSTTAVISGRKLKKEVLGNVIMHVNVAC